MGKQAVQVKLLPTPVQAAALAATLQSVNEAATWTAKIAFAHGTPREYELRQHTYAELKGRGLGQRQQPSDREAARSDG